VPELADGAWHTKFETMSQEIPSSPIEFNPTQSPLFKGFLGGANAEAKSPSQFFAPSVTFDIEVKRVLDERPVQVI
jgi:hypothetical protein